MRVSLAGLILTLSAGAWAGEGFLGTKASPVAGPMSADTGGVGFMSFLQMIVALAIVVVLLKLVLPKVAGRLSKRIVTKTGSTIQIEESAAFAAGSLYIVRAKSKTLLLCASGQGVSCLADLTETVPTMEPKSFQEIIDAELSPEKAVVEADARASLRRLEQLVG